MRKLVIINAMGVCNTPLHPSIQIPPKFEPIPFSNAKSLLGNEYPFAMYDMRAENGVNFNLEAFAIVAGTIQRGGVLYLLCDDWENVENTLDLDSLRWNDDKAIATPKFWGFFKKLVSTFHFDVVNNCRGKLHYPSKTLDLFKSECHSPLRLNADQQFILKNLPLDPADIHLITAPRGRGKSTLSGKLAEMIANDRFVIITARSKSALPNFWRQIENECVQFFAPDHLIQAVENGENFANCWLFIDEAASLPLPMLKTLCSTFGKVIMTTTTQNYEGTGRGFELKLPMMLNKPFRHWTLSQALRWNENDPLEGFVNELLLLEHCRGEPMCSPIYGNDNFSGGHIGPSLQNLVNFYNLLSTAHYKTTPSDLRRLFDGENQHLFEIQENERLIAGCWAVNEGGLSEALTQSIWRGERRPKGNLVVQYLCFQGNLPQACHLRSLRISRIAVQPEMQNKGYGKRLISELILQISDENTLLDFLSVSFGMSDELLHFWQECGFRLVQISQNREASSGLYSAMMLYPISEQGKIFVAQAEQQFLRDKNLQKTGEIQPLNENDWQNLHGFINANRTFLTCYTALLRLYQSNSDKYQWLYNILHTEKKDKFAIKQLKTDLAKHLKT